MENVIVQLINGLPHDEFRHTVIALTDADPAFVKRIERSDVEVVSLHKAPGQPFRLYPAMFSLLRRLNPDVLHSCNLAALEFTPVAWAAGVRRRIHVEHGWDVHDPDGSNRRYRLLRRAYRPFVSHFVAVSAQLASYLRDAVGVPQDRLSLVPNGVDTGRFHPAEAAAPLPAGFPFCRPEHWVIGCVGRLATIKNQTLLAQAFVRLVADAPPGVERLRLAIVGDGPLRPALDEILGRAGLTDRAWLPGNRADIPEVLRAFDCFVLPSLAEGTSCTLQEALATALPIVATDVGGNADVLDDGKLGHLVCSDNVEALAEAISSIFAGSASAELTAAAAREIARQRYSLAGSLTRYESLFTDKKAILDEAPVVR